MSSTRLVETHNPYIFKNGFPTPTGLGPGVGQWPASTGINEIHKWGDWPAQGVIQRGYIMKPFVEHKYHLNVREHELMFVCRAGESVNRYEGESPLTFVNLTAFNQLCKTMFMQAESSINYIASLQTSSDRENVNFFDITPSAWLNILGDDNESVRKNDYLKFLQYLSPDGIINRWNFIGVTYTNPNEVVERYRNPSEYLPVNIALEGPVTIINYWGDNATHSSDLFLIIKRRMIRDEKNNVKWGPLAAVPYASMSPEVPLNEREFLWYDGITRVPGVVIRIGTVIDNTGLSPESDILDRACGFSGGDDGQYQACRALPRLKVHLSHRLRGRFLY